MKKRMEVVLFLTYIVLIFGAKYFFEYSPKITAALFLLPITFILWNIYKSHWLEKHDYRAFIAGKNERFWRLRRKASGLPSR